MNVVFPFLPSGPILLQLSSELYSMNTEVFIRKKNIQQPIVRISKPVFSLKTKGHDMKKV